MRARVGSLMLLAVLLGGCGGGKKNRIETIESAAYQDAQAAYLNDDFGGAAQLFSQFINEGGDYTRHGHMWRGKCYVALAQWDAAIADFQKGMDDDDAFVRGQCYEGYADAQRAKGNHREAMSFYRKALDEAGGELDEGVVYYKLGLATLRGGDWAGGRACMRTVTGKYPRSRFADRAARVLAHPGDYFAVQVGSYSKSDAAYAEKRRVDLLKYESRVVPLITGQETRYILHVGRFPSWNEAQRELEAIKRVYGDAFIVP